MHRRGPGVGRVSLQNAWSFVRRHVGGTAAKEQPMDPVRRPRCYRPGHIRRSRSRCPKSTLRSPRRCSCRARYAGRVSNGALRTPPAPALRVGHQDTGRRPNVASWRCTRPDRPPEEHSLPRGGMTTSRFPSRKDDDLRLGMASLVTTARPSWPRVLSPPASTLPSLRRAHDEVLPTATATTGGPAGSVTRVGHRRLAWRRARARRAHSRRPSSTRRSSWFARTYADRQWRRRPPRSIPATRRAWA